jgi:hypothetical protein
MTRKVPFYKKYKNLEGYSMIILAIFDSPRGYSKYGSYHGIPK